MNGNVGRGTTTPNGLLTLENNGFNQLSFKGTSTDGTLMAANFVRGGTTTADNMAIEPLASGGNVQAITIESQDSTNEGAGLTGKRNGRCRYRHNFPECFIN